MTPKIDQLAIFMLALCCANCSCPNVPPVPVPGDRANAHQVRCHCAFDFDLAAEGLGARDQEFNIDLCLPNRLNANLATGDDARALQAMSDGDYANAVSDYCASDVHDMLIAISGRANSNICGQLDHVAISCSLGAAGPGQSAVVNPMCEVPCADVPCRAPACDPSQVIDSSLMVHPEACKCTEALGCGIHTEVICTTPNWMTDPPTIASGLTTYLLSSPHAAQVDALRSTANMSISVDTGAACGTLTDTATTPIHGTITLFGPPCPPGAACERLMDFTLALDDFSLSYSCAGVTQSAHVTKASVVGGTEGRVVHIDANGTIVIPTNTLRLGGSFLKDGQQQYVVDTHNSEPILLRVDYASGTISLHDEISFIDGSVRLDLVARMENRPPVAHAGEDQHVECEANGAVVTLDATASSDPDSNIRRIQWWAHGHALEESTLVALGPTPSIRLPVGTTELDVGVTDDALLTSIDTVAVSVVDTTPPRLVLSALTPSVLWPPNHRLVPITASIELDEACDLNPTLRLKSVTSNEPDDGCGDGDTTNDVQGADIGTPDLEFLVRAERSGSGGGRIYTVIYEVVDSAGNRTEVAGHIAVPHAPGP